MTDLLGAPPLRRDDDEIWSYKDREVRVSFTGDRVDYVLYDPPPR